jgi:hypothetical protein
MAELCSRAQIVFSVWCFLLVTCKCCLAGSAGLGLFE